MAKSELTLAQAKRIAGRVGARIKAIDDGLQIDISGRSFKDLSGDEHRTTFFAQTPLEAAHTAVIQTAQHSVALLELCKRIYVDEQAFWQSGFNA